MSEPLFLQQLSQEHADCLRFADRLEQLLTVGDSAALAEGVRLIQAYNTAEMEQHLQHEEQTILMPLVQEHREFLPLCMRLGKEHGLLRTLAENVCEVSAAKDIADFARVLREHTLVEEGQLFPALPDLLTSEQMAAVAQFAPLKPKPVIDVAAYQPVTKNTTHQHRQAWLGAVQAYIQNRKQSGVSLVLFAHYQPELVKELAQHLGFSFFNYQQQVMENYREQAEHIPLSSLLATMAEQSQQGSVVFHNTEALLCVKPENERRQWFKEVLDLPTEHLVLIPVSIFQGEVPKQHPGVCDLELMKTPEVLDKPIETTRLPYDLE